MSFRTCSRRSDHPPSTGPSVCRKREPFLDHAPLPKKVSPRLHLLIATALASCVSGPRYKKIRSFLRLDENGQGLEGGLRRDEENDRLKCLRGGVCRSLLLGIYHVP